MERSNQPTVPFENAPIAVRDAAPPRSARFGSLLVLSRMNWVWPELVVEVKYLAWTEEGVVRQVVYEGLRENKPAPEVVHPRGKRS